MAKKNGEYQNKEQDRRLLWLEERYANFNTEMGEVKVCIAKVSATQKVLIALTLLVLGSMVGLFFK